MITYNPNSYPPNTLVRFSASFYNIAGVLADPSTTILWVGGPDGSVAQYNPIKDGVGLYHFDYTTATPGGRWYYRYVGQGAVQAQSLDTIFNVIFPQF